MTNNPELHIDIRSEESYARRCQDYLTLVEGLDSQLREASGQLLNDGVLAITFPDEATTVVVLGHPKDGGDGRLRYRYDARRRHSDAARGLVVEEAQQTDEEWNMIGDGSDLSHISDFYSLLLAGRNTAVKHSGNSLWNDSP